MAMRVGFSIVPESRFWRCAGAIKSRQPTLRSKYNYLRPRVLEQGNTLFAISSIQNQGQGIQAGLDDISEVSTFGK
jgi:hypothetical protein